MYWATVSAIVGPVVWLAVDAGRSKDETVLAGATDDGRKSGDTVLGVEVVAAAPCV